MEATLGPVAVLVVGRDHTSSTRRPPGDMLALHFVLQPCIWSGLQPHVIETATLCAPRRDTTFAQPVKLAGARRFFGSGGGHLELVSRPPQVEKGTHGWRARQRKARRPRRAPTLPTTPHLVRRACAWLLATPVGLNEPPRESTRARPPPPRPVHGLIPYWSCRPPCAVISAVR